MMQNAIMSFNQYPKIHHSTQRAISSTPPPPMLEIFIVCNENDAENGQGKGKGKGTKRDRGTGKGGSDTIFFFVESGKCHGLPRKKRLFKVLSLTLTSK